MSICFADVLVGVVGLLTIGAVSVLAWYVTAETLRFKKQAREFEQQQKLKEIQQEHTH